MSSLQPEERGYYRDTVLQIHDRMTVCCQINDLAVRALRLRDIIAQIHGDRGLRGEEPAGVDLGDRQLGDLRGARPQILPDPADPRQPAQLRVSRESAAHPEYRRPGMPQLPAATPPAAAPRAVRQRTRPPPPRRVRRGHARTQPQ